MNQNLKGKLIGIFFLLMTLFFCKSCTSSYLEGGNYKFISNYEKMIFDKSIATATLSDEYNETSIKIAGMKSKSYDFRYKFNVKNEEFEGTKTFYKLPETKQLEIYYLSTNPNFNCDNPKDLLFKEKEKDNSKGDLYWAILWGVLSLSASYSLFQLFKDKTKTLDTL